MAGSLSLRRRKGGYMQHFSIKKDVDRRGQEWSPQTTMICPFCEEENSCYCQLRDNKCTVCHKEMPFPSAMFKELDKRIQYHFED